MTTQLEARIALLHAKRDAIARCPMLRAVVRGSLSGVGSQLARTYDGEANHPPKPPKN